MQHCLSCLLLTRQETTVWEMSLEEQRIRSQQQFVMLYYLGLQAGLNSVQVYNAAGSAIRMDGATSPSRDMRACRVIITLIIYRIRYHARLWQICSNDSGYFGTPGSSSRARIINGTVDEAYALFDHLSSVYTHESVGGYGGVTRELPNGGYVTFRPDSKSGSPAIDIRGIPEIKNQKIHFH